MAGFLIFTISIQSQINNVQVSVDGEQIIILYDYIAQQESIDDIIVTYTTGNEPEIKEAKQVTGDVHDIFPGTGKRIVWSPLNEMTSFSAENLVVRLTGVRNPSKQIECDNNMKIADKFFGDKNHDDALVYYNEMFNCITCNCHPKDLAYASEQIKKINTFSKIKDKFQISYLFDMATAKGGNNMHGVSASLLRYNGFGYYASFRSDKNFYLPQSNMYYYEDDKNLWHDNMPAYMEHSRISSWLFSSGITYNLLHAGFVSVYGYGGLGIGSNSIAGKYTVTETGHTENVWITNGVSNLFLSPEIGATANLFNYFFVMAGVKCPVSLTKTESIKAKTISAMAGIGFKLKSIDRKEGYQRANSFIAYTIDIPDKSGPDKIQSLNIIGISAGLISHHKAGSYISMRLNPLLFSNKGKNQLTGNESYTGLYDYANFFLTGGLTWMYFYGGIGFSYQKEYKIYEMNNEEIWNSTGEKFGLCTEFGINLSLFDKLLLRGGFTFPDFRISSRDDFKMGSNKMLITLGIGYVLPKH